MDLLNKVLSIFKSPESVRNYWFYILCNNCKEIIEGRVDLYNHLSLQYGESKKQNSYFCRKVMIGGNRCYRPIEVEFWFDTSRKLTDSHIKGGKFVTKEEFLTYQDEIE